MEIISPEDVILSKLRWYREAPVQYRQLQDVLDVLREQAGHLDDEYLDHWAPALAVAELLANLCKRVNTQ